MPQSKPFLFALLHFSGGDKFGFSSDPEEGWMQSVDMLDANFLFVLLPKFLQESCPSWASVLMCCSSF